MPKKYGRSRRGSRKRGRGGKYKRRSSKIKSKLGRFGVRSKTALSLSKPSSYRPNVPFVTYVPKSMNMIHRWQGNVKSGVQTLATTPQYLSNGVSVMAIRADNLFDCYFPTSPTLSATGYTAMANYFRQYQVHGAVFEWEAMLDQPGSDFGFPCEIAWLTFSQPNGAGIGYSPPLPANNEQMYGEFAKNRLKWRSVPHAIDVQSGQARRCKGKIYVNCDNLAHVTDQATHNIASTNARVLMMPIIKSDYVDADGEAQDVQVVFRLRLRQYASWYDQNADVTPA